MRITQTMLDVCEEALYHLRQDVSIPKLAEAETDTGMEWVKCRKAFGYAAAEVLAAHDWRFARNGTAAKESVDGWPENVRKALVYCLARELAVQIAGRTEDLKNLHQLYNRFLFDAKLKDLEEDRSEDQVCKEVVATLRGYFSDESKDIPRSMVSLYERIGAVRESSFEEVRAAHGWNNGAAIAGETALPPLARAAFVALVCNKLAVACGLPHEAVGQLAEIYEQKLVRARVADLEATKSSDPVVKEVVAAVRPFFSLEQKNLPHRMLDLYERVDAVKSASFGEILAAHEWTGKAAITDGNKLPPIARAAWIALIEAKLCVACGIAPEAVAKLEEVYLLKLNQARVADLEASEASDPVVKEVLAAVRPFFASDQKNLPRRMLDLYGRVDAVKTAAFEEVKAAHEWANKAAITDGNKLPPIARAAWITLVEIKLGVACGIPPEAVAQWQNVYLAKLNQARVVDLEASKSSDPVVREVLAAVRPFLSLDQRNLPLRMLDLHERVDAVRDAAFREVLAAHEWTDKEEIGDPDKLPPIARAAWIALIESKVGTAAGIPQEAVANLQGVYLQRLVQARVADLELRHSGDPVVEEVLAGIRPTFAFDQKNVPMTMLSLYGRIGAVRASAFGEILAAHNWRGKECMKCGNDLPPQARAAWIALMQQKLCVACGLSPEAAASFESVWRAKLKEARVTDLETEPAPEGIAGEVLTLIRDTFDPTETNLPMDLKALADRVERMKPIAMKEVLSAHPWGFAMEEDVTRSGRLDEEGLGEYVHWVPVPHNSVKIVGVYGRGGDLLQWERVSGQIRAYGEICRVTYVRRVEDLAEFSPDAYRLVVLRLAADMSRAMSMRTSVQNLHENIYRDALAEAKCRDTRQSNPGAESVWGGNHYVEAMEGR